MKLALELQSRLKESYREFYVKPTNCSVADARSQLNGSTDRHTDRRTQSLHTLFVSYFPKNSQNRFFRMYSLNYCSHN